MPLDSMSASELTFIQSTLDRLGKTFSSLGIKNADQCTQWDLSPPSIAEKELKISRKELSSRLEHTLLSPLATQEEVLKHCQEAIENQFFAVCLHPYWIPLAQNELKNHPISIVSVSSFPHGLERLSVKLNELQDLKNLKVDEIDFVLNLGALKSGHFKELYQELSELVKAADPVPLKVIFETGVLSLEEKISACTLSRLAKVSFFKTSTGTIAGHGATAKDVTLLRLLAGPQIQVKASGGIRTVEDVHQMIQAGAHRIGSSSGVSMIDALS